ncbi:MAG TPA: serine/threonine-protein kinase, partial [Polyangiaceae bacterium LLY-WYZ-15_(1-7)]|nr:serine/threonine-protein kinase [Polyangiaceae bacterium LLY-WYZ-15_(1-7)]
MPASPLRPGTLIEGRYRLLRPLGEGGMAVVWRALHIQRGTEVALKLVPDADAIARERFRREALLGARLRHPHLVSVLDTGTHEGSPYLVMELLEGRTLGARLLRALPSLPEAIDITAKLLAGLAAAHREGLIHRDVKPENVILGAQGQLWLVDFGLVKQARHPTRVAGGTIEMVVGTPHYMSPEQVRSSRHLDARTDVFGVGALLYELLVGETPFAAEGPLEVMRRVERGEYVPLALRRPDLSSALTAVVERALAPRREDRFEHAGAMREALVSAVEEFGRELEAAYGERTATSAALRQQALHLRGEGPPPRLLERAWAQWGPPRASDPLAPPASRADQTTEARPRSAALPSHPAPAAPRPRAPLAAAALALLGLLAGGAWLLASPAERSAAERPPPVAAGPRLDSPAAAPEPDARTSVEGPEQTAAPTEVAVDGGRGDATRDAGVRGGGTAGTAGAG